MATFQTQITDANVIAELPDVSILASLYDDNATQQYVLQSMNSVSFRKKFQALLEFKLSDASRDALRESLKQAYIQYETDQGRTVTESGGNIFVDNRLVAFTIDGFADGLFEDESFAALFFTQEVIDAIFTSGDESFINALVNVSNFWDKLLSNETLAEHFLTTYPELVSELVRTSEVSYTKIVAYKAGIDFAKYKNIQYLAEDSPAMDAIYLIPEARAIEANSPFGAKARLMYVFNNSDINAIANSDDNIARVNGDESLRRVVVDFDTVTILPKDSKMRQLVLNNDGYFGAIASERLNADTVLSLSNIFYDDAYSDVKRAFVQDDALVSMLFESSLYNNFKDQFYEAFVSLNIASQEFAVKVNDSTNTIVASYTNREFTAKQFTLPLDSFTETKAASVATVQSDDKMFFVPYTFSDSSIFGIKLDHEALFTNPDNYNLYDEFVGVKLSTVIGSSGHIVGIATDGNVISSKFVVELNLSTEHIDNIQVTADAAFIKTAETYHVFGNIGDNKDAKINVVITNKDSIKKAALFGGDVIALFNDGTLKKVNYDGVENYATTDGLDISDFMIVRERLLILLGTGELKEVKTDGTIVDVAASVTDLAYAEDAIVCRVSGNKRLVFNSNGQWYIYDYTINTL